MAARQGGSAAVVSERDGRRHIVVLRQQCGATFRARNYSLAVGFGWGCRQRKPPECLRAANGAMAHFHPRLLPCAAPETRSDP